MVVAAVAASGASLLNQRIDELLRTAKAIAPGVAGVAVVQIRSGKILYARNADKLFTPASNTKLFSTSLALMRLGPDHHMTTRLYAEEGPDVNGRVSGSLVLYGGGDPSMSDVQIPYQKDAQPLDPLLAIESFADEMVAHGVRVVEGDVAGDDSLYVWEPYPPGWAEDDAIWEYGAPVSALTLNHGVLKLSIEPGKQAGDPALLSLNPPVEYYAISNRIQTVASGEQKIRVDRLAGSRELRLSGTVVLNHIPAIEELAVDDPALFTATALYNALIHRGVSVHGRPVARHRVAGESPHAPVGKLIAERQSPPLLELVRVVDKVSQNLWAELMLREVGRVLGGDGSRTAGLDQLKIFLSEIGVPKDSYVFEDGSGLSRLTLVSPDMILRLLRYMYLSPQGANWKALLPIGAQDGTLSKRFAGNSTAAAIVGKTGSLSHVNALSGYADSGTYGEVAFSIIVNHTNAHPSEVRTVIDKIALALLE
jgi:serine-type D-Ala-D-Ala carboxypeptidase/endopeptidase (penicillin-binding protein 4)